MSVSRKLMGTTKAGGGQIDISDYFSTYLYTGNGSTQTITNGIDLAGEGGLVWIKIRETNGGEEDHRLYDTIRGAGNSLSSNKTGATATQGNSLGAFNSDGFYLNGSFLGTNGSGYDYASWTFRKAPRFFDVVTYTGTGAARTVAHNLGIEPGCIIVKATSSAGDWWVYHRSLGATQRISLNATNASAANVNPWNNTEPTEAEFSLSSGVAGNDSGTQYVAYLFAHDPLGPTGDGSDGLIACGSYTTDGSGNATVDLGWEPQWVMTKSTNTSGSWMIVDNMRGMPTSGTGRGLRPNSNIAEFDAGAPNPNATGFSLSATFTSTTFSYIAIRRGPMRVPESGTEVFATSAVSLPTGSQVSTGFPVDMQISRTGARSDVAYQMTSDRLRGVSTTNTDSGARLWIGATSAEASDVWTRNWNNTGFQIPTALSGYNTTYQSFRRAPGFFDVVAYTGDGTNDRAISHNLTAPPEMAIVKARNQSQQWIVWHKDLGFSGLNYFNLFLNSTTAKDFFSFNSNGSNSISPNPTETTISVGGPYTNNSASQTYIAYLFATLAGISKVGSYTGNGTTLNIDCGFTTGARFVLIKGSSFTHDWHVFDTARGIVAGNDPFLELNTTNAENASYDAVDPLSSGFTINQTAVANLNANGASYIFYAIA